MLWLSRNRLSGSHAKATQRDNDRDRDTSEALRDGRPVEVRDGDEPPSDVDANDDIPDPDTVRSIGY